MVQGLGQAIEVANTVTIAIAPTANKDFHKGTSMPPLLQEAWFVLSACLKSKKKSQSEQHSFGQEIRFEKHVSNASAAKFSCTEKM
jgi:hypothetical protein